MASAHAQSFNSRYAKTADEVLICQAAKLSALDERLASIYSRLHRLVPRARSVQHERSQCGRDAAHIAELYLSRNGALTVKLAVPKAVGECVTTTIEKVNDWLGAPASNSPRPDGVGSAAAFAGGAYHVSYD